jgi:hypothetical protein
MKIINSPEQLFHHFAASDRKYVFTSLTPIHLLGLQKHIKGLTFLNPTDLLNDQLPELLTPDVDDANKSFSPTTFLNRGSVRDLIEKKLQGASAPFLFFTVETEKAAKKAGLTVCFPPARIRRKIENKCTGKRLAVQAGVKTVPHLIQKITSYDHLREATTKYLGIDLVIQLPYGNSGLTTFFISNEADYDQYAEKIEQEKEVLIMKKLRSPAGIALEACITDAGIIVGIPMRETIGVPALTPLKGAWCGNQMGSRLFSRQQIDYLREAAMKLCTVIKKMYPQYFGCIEFDFLLEKGDLVPYFGEINARLTGATPLTNQTNFPLFLFHLAQFERLKLGLDFGTLNAELMDHVDTWSSLIIKHIMSESKRIRSLPQAGIYVVRQGKLVFHRASADPAGIKTNRELFLIPEVSPNDITKKSDILIRVYIRGTTTKKGVNELNERASTIVHAIREATVLTDV